MSVQNCARERENFPHFPSKEYPGTVRLSAQDYAMCNRVQRKYNQFVLQFCQLSFRTQPSLFQQFLDVGCGTGDFTRDVLLPLCQPCRRIVGVDCSPEMVEYAKRHAAHTKLEFSCLDIGADVSGFIEEFGHFERIYSFYCLHWVEDIAAAFKNIARLLAPQGECLLVFFASHEPAVVWRDLSKTDRWAHYAKTLLKYIPETQDMSDKREKLRFVSRLLKEAGLFPSICEILRCTTFDGCSEEEIAATYMNVLPIIKLLSPEEKDEMAAIMGKYARKLHAPDADRDAYSMFIIKASKIAEEPEA